MFKRFEKFSLVPPMVFAAVMFLVGITWGLPSRKVDPFLFGDRPVWTGEKITQLLPERSTIAMGADVDPNAHMHRPVVVNDTDAQRAEILVRYRLYSYQPDEMITFRPLHDCQDPWRSTVVPVWGALDL